MKDEFVKAMNYYAKRPYSYVNDLIKGATPTRQQALVLNSIIPAIKEKKGIAVRSGHGVGKTCCEAWIINWFMSVFPNARVIATAPTNHQLLDVLWPEVAKWLERTLYFNEWFEWTKTAIHHKKYPNTWFGVARSASKPEALAGKHEQNLLVIVDEASGVEDNMIETLEGTQTQSNNLMIMFSNPTKLSGGFFDSFGCKRMFYINFVFSTLEASIERPDIIDPNYAIKMKSKYGDDSDVYLVRVLGEFPKSEPDTIISITLAEEAAIREVKELEIWMYEIIELGVDVARFGDDESVICSRIGDVIKQEATFRKRDLMELVGWVVQTIHKYDDVKNVIVNIDDSGMGGGVTDRLRELVREGKIKAVIVPVNNGSAAVNFINFNNLVSEMWYAMKEWLKSGKIPNDNDMIAQLTTRKSMMHSSGRIMVEKKEDMKKRGLTSPDRADAAILTLTSIVKKTRKFKYKVA